jgi:hypothetical protein
MQLIDGANFLKTVPGVIGLAGLFTYFMREQKPASRVEFVNLVRSVQAGFVLLGCTALILLSLWLLFRPEPPDHAAALAIHSTVASDSGRKRTICQVRPHEAGCKIPFLATDDQRRAFG